MSKSSAQRQGEPVLSLHHAASAWTLFPVPLVGTSVFIFQAAVEIFQETWVKSLPFIPKRMGVPRDTQVEESFFLVQRKMQLWHVLAMMGFKLSWWIGNCTCLINLDYVWIFFQYWVMVGVFLGFIFLLGTNSLEKIWILPAKIQVPLQQSLVKWENLACFNPRVRFFNVILTS